MDAVSLGLFVNGLSALIGKAFEPSLRKDIEKTVLAWAKQLPDHLELEPRILFPQATAGDQATQAEEDVAARLKEKGIPDAEHWLEGLLAKWQRVVALNNEAAFFQLTPEDATSRLKPLAKSLAEACSRHAEYFRTQAYQDLQTIKSGVLDIKKRLEQSADPIPPFQVQANQKCGRSDPEWCGIVVNELQTILSGKWKKHCTSLHFELTKETCPSVEPKSVAETLVQAEIGLAVLASTNVLKSTAIPKASREELWQDAAQMMEWLITLEVDCAWVQAIGEQLQKGHGLQIPVTSEFGIEIVHSRMGRHKTKVRFDRVNDRPLSGNAIERVLPPEDWYEESYALEMKQTLFKWLFPNKKLPRQIGPSENRMMNRQLNNLKINKESKFLLIHLKEHFDLGAQSVKILLQDLPDLKVFYLGNEAGDDGVLVTYVDEIEIIVTQFFNLRKKALGG